MKQRSTTVTINGRVYDALSGKPVSSAVTTAKKSLDDVQQHTKKVVSDFAPAPKKASSSTVSPAHSVHKNTQRSQTLRRESLARPIQKHMDGSSRSPMISKFGSVHSNDSKQVTKESHAQAAPVANSVATKQFNSHQPHTHLSGKELKEQLIKERLDEIDSHKKTTSKKKKIHHNFLKANSRLTSVLTASLALLILAGYLTYLNLPNISMRVAASRAGISANFPGYKPDGYSLSGPITYSPGEVAVNYRSNASNAGFSLTQKASNWDSQAVLDNYVLRQTSTYLTYQERGVTVYTFGNKAVWVNGGLLYSVDGDASLSSDQVLKLASSL